MGYNRGGARRTKRLRRRKRLENRLAQQRSEQEAPPKENLGQKVKHMAQEAAEKVGDVLHAAAEKVKEAVK
ncbi:MAG TPA: hypothetical protein VMG10_13235 [Gemmataceae bacterium]|nr:hypothetical protein [Gemmataceae bacterium]